MSNLHITVFMWYGKAVSLYSIPVPGLAGDQGWATLETVIIRANTNFTPSGHFPAYSNEGRSNGVDKIGFDAAVCVQRYESWIIETYNTSVTSPSVLRIVGKENGNHPLLPRGNIQGTPIENTRYLNTTGKNEAFNMIRLLAMDQMLKDANADEPYILPIRTVGPAVPRVQHVF